MQCPTLLMSKRKDNWEQLSLIKSDCQRLKGFLRLGYLPPIVIHGLLGVGKTTLARHLASEFNYQIIECDATDTSLAQLGDIQRDLQLKSRRLKPRVVVFIDEIHRFSRRQQDWLLGYVESGEFLFIGATTYNIHHRLNRALLSRCHWIEMVPPSAAALADAVAEAVAITGTAEFTVTQTGNVRIAEASASDFRRAKQLVALIHLTYGDRFITDDEVNTVVDRSCSSKLSRSDRNWLFRRVEGCLNGVVVGGKRSRQWGLKYIDILVAHGEGKNVATWLITYCAAHAADDTFVTLVRSMKAIKGGADPGQILRYGFSLLHAATRRLTPRVRLRDLDLVHTIVNRDRKLDRRLTAAVTFDADVVSRLIPRG